MKMRVAKNLERPLTNFIDVDCKILNESLEVFREIHKYFNILPTLQKIAFFYKYQNQIAPTKNSICVEHEIENSMLYKYFLRKNKSSVPAIQKILQDDSSRKIYFKISTYKTDHLRIIFEVFIKYKLYFENAIPVEVLRLEVCKEDITITCNRGYKWSKTTLINYEILKSLSETLDYKKKSKVKIKKEQYSIFE